MSDELITNNTGISVIKFRSFEWNPQEDITAHELALCLPMMFSQSPYYLGAQYDNLPDNAKRHLREL